MKLTTRKDIEAPLDKVWTILTDFEHWERAAMRRGVEVHRGAADPAGALPLSWSAVLTWRERVRKVDLAVVEQDPPQRLVISAGGDTVAGNLVAELMEMGPQRTRILVAMEIKPLSLAARLFLQSMKLVRGRLQDKLDQRVGAFATDVESRAGRKPPTTLRR